MPSPARRPGRLNYGDAKHWRLDVGRFSLLRWCKGDGPPCQEPAGHTDRGHLIRVEVYRRAGSARFDED